MGTQIDIHSSNVAPKELQKEAKQPTSENRPEPQVRDGAEVYPDAGVMRAYANIKPSGDTVSPSEVRDFIHSTGCKFEQRCEEFVSIMTDDDGYIKRDTFDWVKNGYEKSKNLFVTTHLLQNSKENGKINPKVLEILEPVLPHIKSLGTYAGPACSELPKFFKDKDGRFDNDFLEVVKHTVGNNPAMILRRPDVFKFYYFTKDNEFDKGAVQYALEQIEAGKPVKDIQTEIGFAKDEAGVFSRENLDVYNLLKTEGFEQWQIKKAQEMMKTAQNKDECLAVVKQMRDNRDVSDVIDMISDIKSSENNKTDFDYNEQSLNLITELRKDSYGWGRNIPLILKTINLPLSEYTPENVAKLKRIFGCMRNEEDIKTLLDAATYKSGDKKGQFSFDNLSKYIDIYHLSAGDAAYVQKLAGTLSLEPDDYVLDTMHKLLNLTWEKENKWNGKTEEKLNRLELMFILEMACLSHDGVPKRPAHRPVFENLNKLMESELPMSSKDAFENFMVIPEFDVIDKLTKVRLDEVGIKTGQYTHGKFCSATEEELFAFKKFMKEYMEGKDPRYVDVELNGNLMDVIEIKEENFRGGDKILMYDLVKRKPTTEVTEVSGLYNVKREQQNFENNLITKQVFRKERVKYGEVERLVEQTTEKYDDNGNLIYSELMDKSPVEGVFNVKRTYADGRVEDLVKAEKLPNGNDLVKKSLTSFDGTRTEYYYEDDVNGNRIMDYKIIAPDGTVKMNKSVTFEVIDDNHFVSSRNDKKFDIKFSDKTITVTNLSTKEKVDIDVENFTKSTQDKIIPLLKQIPGDELFAMKKLDLGGFSNDNSVDNAAYRPGSSKNKSDNGEILISDKYIDGGVALHEWGHGKDSIEFKEIAEEINQDPVLRDIYRKEKATFRANFSDAQLSHIAYFGADMHYLGSDNAIQEGIAETNAILSVLPKNEVSSVRAHYWMQYFPNTIAYLSSLLF